MIVYKKAYQRMFYQEVNAFNGHDMVCCCQQKAKAWYDSKVRKSKNLINQMISQEKKLPIESLKPGALLMKISLLKHLKS